MSPRTANMQRMDLLRNRQMSNAVTKGLAIATSPTFRSKTAPEPSRASHVLKYAIPKPSIAEIKAGSLPKNSHQSPSLKPPKFVSRPWRSRPRPRAKSVPALKPDLVSQMQSLPQAQLQEILQKRVKLPSLLQTLSRAGKNLRNRENHIKVHARKASDTAIKNAAASRINFVKKDPELMLYELEAMKSLMLRQQYMSGLRAFVPRVARVEAEVDDLPSMSPTWEKKIAEVPKLQRELCFLIKSLRAATVATVKAVKTWRAQLLLHSRETGDHFLKDDSSTAIFNWHGENYLITATTDVLRCLRSTPQSTWLRLWLGVTEEEDWACWDPVLRCTDTDNLLAKAQKRCKAAVDDTIRIMMLQQEEALEALKEKERVEAERLAMSALYSDDEDSAAGEDADGGAKILSTERILEMGHALRRAIGPLQPLFDALPQREQQGVRQCQNYLQAEVRLQARVDAANARQQHAMPRVSTAQRSAMLGRALSHVNSAEGEAAKLMLRERQEQGIAERRLRRNGVALSKPSSQRLRPRLAAHKQTFAARVSASVDGRAQTVMVRQRREILVRKPVRPSKRTQSRSALRIQSQYRRYAAESEYRRKVDSATAVQKTFRGYNARTTTLQANQDSTFLTQDKSFSPGKIVETDMSGAATIVQSAYRGHRSRQGTRAMLKREHAARRIQAVRRGHDARTRTAQIRKHNSTILRGRARNRHTREQRKQYQAAARIQGLYRIREAKETAKVQKAGAVIVGAAKQRLEKVNDAATTIQSQVRRQQAVKTTDHKRQVVEREQLKALQATKIQSVVRGRQGRKVGAQLKLEARVANLSERQQSWLKGSGPALPVENKPTKATRKSTKRTEHASIKPTAIKVSVSKPIAHRKSQPVAKGVLRVREATLDL